MPAVHDHIHTAREHLVEAREVVHFDPAAMPDPEVRRRQLSDHLLRELEARRLPEALTLLEQVRAGDVLDAQARASLAELVLLLEQSPEHLEDAAHLADARQGVARLCDEILTRNHANEQARRLRSGIDHPLDQSAA